MPATSTAQVDVGSQAGVAPGSPEAAIVLLGGIAKIEAALQPRTLVRDRGEASTAVAVPAPVWEATGSVRDCSGREFLAVLNEWRKQRRCKRCPRAEHRIRIGDRCSNENRLTSASVDEVVDAVNVSPEPYVPSVVNIYQLKVTLMGTRPPIWRRLVVPGNLNFERLHYVIQDAMGWDDCHLHSFDVGGVEIGVRPPTIGPRGIDRNPDDLGRRAGRTLGDARA